MYNGLSGNCCRQAVSSLVVSRLCRGGDSQLKKRFAQWLITVVANGAVYLMRNGAKYNRCIRDSEKTIVKNHVNSELKSALDDYHDFSQVKESEPESRDAAERVQTFFKTVAGEDMEIDWSELQEVLNMAMKRGMFVFKYVWMDFFFILGMLGEFA